MALRPTNDYTKTVWEKVKGLMNSRERLLSTLAGRIPDQVPISTYELSGYNSQSFENNDPSYARLMDAIRCHTDCVCMWDPNSNERFAGSSFDAEIAKKVTRDEKAKTTTTVKTVQTPGGPLRQLTRVDDNIHTVWEVEHFCKTTEDVDRALSLPFEPVNYDSKDYARIVDEVGDRGIIMSSLADPLWMAAGLMSFQEFTIWAMTEEAHFAKTVEIMRERCMANLRNILNAQVVDLYRICGPEYATPPYLPPVFFEKYVVPGVRDMIDRIHEKGAIARLHSHGRVGHVLDFMRDTGADAVDPCEAPPDGDIELAEVKQRVGDTMCIFGNIQLKLLERGTPQQVEAEVIKTMEMAKANGRFIIMPTAAPINSPLDAQTEENYLQFFRTAKEHGIY